jgi:hypothetical protein
MSENLPVYGFNSGMLNWNDPFGDLEQFMSVQFDTTKKDQEREEVKQRTVAWFLARWDKFTGSRIPDLMKGGRAKADLWGETAKKIILEIASYQMMSDEGRELYAVEQMYKDFRATAWGTKYEPEARAKYAEVTGYEVSETGFRVHPEIEYMGGSFDGEVEGGIIEIKCPYDPIRHAQNRGAVINERHDYYGQIQANIEVAGVQWCDFVSYDPRCKPEHQISITRVPRDQAYINQIIDRVHKAKRILDGYLAGRSMQEMCEEVERTTEAKEDLK